MKQLLYLGVLVNLGLLLSGCPSRIDTKPYTEYTPIMMQREQLRKSVKIEPPTTIINTGKIYTKGNYIFIGESFEGFHVINNSDPKNPIKEGFIRIPGCVDIAIKDNILYADNAVDLVSLDISDVKNIHEVNRVENTLPELLPPDLKVLPDVYTVEKRPPGLIIVGWKKNQGTR